MSILSIQNLSKSFIVDKKKISVLDNISLEIKKGDIFGVIGLSGEGKSTLVRCINLLEKPDSGNITYYTENVEFCQHFQIEFKNLKEPGCRG